MKIDKILLRAERPEDAPEDTLGITRIEEVVKVMDDGSEESDNCAGFEYSFHDDSDSDFQEMIESVAKQYGVETDKVQFTRE